MNGMVGELWKESKRRMLVMNDILFIHVIPNDLRCLRAYAREESGVWIPISSDSSLPLGMTVT